MQSSLNFAAYKTREFRQRIAFFDGFGQLAQNLFLIVLLAEKTPVNPFAQTETIEQNKRNGKRDAKINVNELFKVFRSMCD